MEIDYKVLFGEHLRASLQNTSWVTSSSSTLITVNYSYYVFLSKYRLRSFEYLQQSLKRGSKYSWKWLQSRQKKKTNHLIISPVVTPFSCHSLINSWVEALSFPGRTKNLIFILLYSSWKAFKYFFAHCISTSRNPPDLWVENCSFKGY